MAKAADANSTLADILSWSSPEQIESQILAQIPISPVELQSQPVFIFGAHTVGKQICLDCQTHRINVQGFLDNAVAKKGTRVLDLPVTTPDSIDRNAIVILASGNYSFEIGLQLREMGFKKIVNLSQFYFLLKIPGQPERDYVQELFENKEKYLKLEQLLEDEESRRVLRALVQYRSTFNLEFTKSINDKKYPQWFDKDLITFRDEMTFVDGGGFDGDTGRAFSKVCNGNFKKAYIFEPDPELAGRATQSFAGDERVRVLNAALSDRKDFLKFGQTGVTNGSLESGEGILVETTKIDAVVGSEKVDFIKLDVEGAEDVSLAGARATILAGHPILAVAAYHKASDLYRLIDIIRSIRTDYKFYLRHYTQVGFESVIYAIPR